MNGFKGVKNTIGEEFMKITMRIVIKVIFLK